MKQRRCRECGEGSIASVARPGRFMRYKTMPRLEIPAEVAIPTCSKCGAEWINNKTADSIDEALERVYEEKLWLLARGFLDRLFEARVTQQRIESLLGLSQGYLSKLKNYERKPSPMIVTQLGLLAHDPERRTQEISDIWCA